MLRLGGPLRTDKLNWELTPSGLLRAHVTLGQAGKELKYYQWDGEKLNERVEVVFTEELFSEDSLRSAFGKPLSLGHPQRGKFEQNEENLLIGSTLETFHKDGDILTLSCAVQDKRGIELVEAARALGKKPEISPGYVISELKPLGGNKYAQIGRRYDHFALLLPDEGRGGQEICLRMDKGEPVKDIWAARQFFVLPEKANINFDSHKGGKMAKSITLDGVNYEISDESLLGAIANLKSRNDQLETELQQAKENANQAKSRADSLQREKARLEGENAGLKERAEQAENNRLDEDTIAAEIQSRLDTWDEVLPVLRQYDANFKPDWKLDTAGIIRLFLSKKMPDLNLDGKDAGYIEAFYQGLMSSKERVSNSVERSDSLLESLNRHLVRTDAEQNREDARRNAAKRIQQARTRR